MESVQPYVPLRRYFALHGTSAGRKTFPVLECFVTFQILSLVALLFGASSAVRPYVRIVAFGSSVAVLLFSPKKGTARHPSAGPAQAVLLILALSFFNPGTAGLVAGLAQLLMYFCILAPLFWTHRLSITPVQLRHVVLILWAFHSLSAGIGVLQVRFPGRFQPNLSAVIAARDFDYTNSLTILNAQGERVFRPMGLTDVPGGAAIAGFYASLLGIGLALTSSRPLLKALALAGVLVGLTCIYMSQVRSVLVMLAASIVALALILLLRGEKSKLILLSVFVVFVVLLGFWLAVAVAGSSVTKRLSTFTETDMNQMYYQNRGHFLSDTIDILLPEYPLGAGLGRWGMMNSYFADTSDPERPPLWAEIQLTGWLVDGGVPLVLAYVATIGVAFVTAFKLAVAPGAGELWLWGAIVLAYNLGAMAMTFDYPFFNSQGGLELWMLNGALFAAAQCRRYVAIPCPGVGR